MFIREVELSQDAITKLKQKYVYFSLSILYLCTTPNTPPEAESFDKLYVLVPNTHDNWEWNIARVQLRGNFPVEYANIIEATRNICVQSESISTSSKVKDTLNRVSVQTKKLSDEIGNLDKINISQQSYFLYDDSNLVKETFTSELDKKISIYVTISYFERIKENNQINMITPTNKLKFNVRENRQNEELVLD